jgi:hypothetical protein
MGNATPKPTRVNENGSPERGAVSTARRHPALLEQRASRRGSASGDAYVMAKSAKLKPKDFAHWYVGHSIQANTLEAHQKIQRMLQKNDMSNTIPPEHLQALDVYLAKRIRYLHESQDLFRRSSQGY